MTINGQATRMLLTLLMSTNQLGGIYLLRHVIKETWVVDSKVDTVEVAWYNYTDMISVCF